MKIAKNILAQTVQKFFLTFELFGGLGKESNLLPLGFNQVLLPS